jgi:hypothetical protein
LATASHINSSFYLTRRTMAAEKPVVAVDLDEVLVRLVNG